MPNQNKLDQIRKLLDTAHVSLESARQLLVQVVGKNDTEALEVASRAKEVGSESVQGTEKIIEGIFDGQHMVGPDGKQYSVPANYASKSKLVVGDTLKLTIKDDGSFLYKQIGPIERGRLVGLLTRDETTDEYRVVVGDRSYKVLLASITYFRGEAGDEVVILVPKDRETEWAAVENIIKAAGGAGEQPAAGGVPTVQIAADQATEQPAGQVEDIEELS
ncbi:MAG: hypothetical protein WC505_05490 [Patescibacteria group bacterium]